MFWCHPTKWNQTAQRIHHQQQQQLKTKAITATITTTTTIKSTNSSIENPQRVSHKNESAMNSDWWPIIRRSRHILCEKVIQYIDTHKKTQATLNINLMENSLT